MEDNKECRQIGWKYEPEIVEKWENGQTGYPAIDAVMRQLVQEGWIHHLGRHLVACFLTRGDLFQHWQLGRNIFDKYLLDADWSLNNANWQWLSCSRFFYQYFRVYSPVKFFQKYDKQGLYVRKYCPELRNMPDQFVYEPWKAPINVQKQCNCIVGQDYPKPMVEHDQANKENQQKMRTWFKKQQGQGQRQGQNDDKEGLKKRQSRIEFKRKK